MRLSRDTHQAWRHLEVARNHTDRPGAESSARDDHLGTGRISPGQETRPRHGPTSRGRGYTPRRSRLAAIRMTALRTLLSGRPRERSRPGGNQSWPRSTGLRMCRRPAPAQRRHRFGPRHVETLLTARSRSASSLLGSAPARPPPRRFDDLVTVALTVVTRPPGFSSEWEGGPRVASRLARIAAHRRCRGRSPAQSRGIAGAGHTGLSAFPLRCRRRRCGRGSLRHCGRGRSAAP